ncbi:hypothetical protein [Nesterenkonia sp. DZ6]|uniref:hypothetical protein n=1 Tax=Nesterenkonia sp. DZ6 TaxID=2901229 RepID=UPI001F4D1E59|nr:hypothetical protein [Nesterenkonia sp. DZ6]MCH8559370.1 hypothetical protein [Nesterenkonia sp. DZ6]
MTKTGRNTAAAVLLVAAAALALLGVLVHHSFTAEYGIITHSAVEGLVWGFTAGLSGAALVLVGVVAVFALVLSPRPWMRWTAVAIPVLMLLGMLALTPVALQQKTEAQYDAVPQCVTEGSGEPAAAAERESQRAFDSIEHVGYFGGGGASGVDGCDRSLVVSEEVDVLEHYRAALPEAGWEVIEDDGRHLRAQREGMAFEVALCPGGGVVWAGSDDGAGAQCEPG